MLYPMCLHTAYIQTACACIYCLQMPGDVTVKLSCLAPKMFAYERLSICLSDLRLLTMEIATRAGFTITTVEAIGKLTLLASNPVKQMIC